MSNVRIAFDEATGNVLEYARAESTGETDGAALLDELAGFVRRFVVVTPEQADVLALYVLHTHAFAAFEVTPYLHVTAPTMRAGKTRLLEVLRTLVARPRVAANLTDAVLFRVIHKEQPTLLLDEVDAVFSSRAKEKEDLRAMLNAGYMPGVSALRMGGTHRDELQEFNIFCPKVLVGIGKLPPTIADRCLPIRLKRRTAAEPVEKFRLRTSPGQAEPLRDRAQSWAERQRCRARPDYPGPPADQRPRR